MHSDWRLRLSIARASSALHGFPLKRLPVAFRLALQLQVEDRGSKGNWRSRRIRSQMPGKWRMKREEDCQARRLLSKLITHNSELWTSFRSQITPSNKTPEKEIEDKEGFTTCQKPLMRALKATSCERKGPESSTSPRRGYRATGLWVENLRQDQALLETSKENLWGSANAG